MASAALQFDGPDAPAPFYAAEPEPAPAVRGAAEKLEQWLEAERDQLPLWIPVLFGAGIASWFALPGPVAWIGAIFVALGVAAAGLMLDARATRMGRAVMLAGLLVAAGIAAIWWRSERVAAPVLERPVVVGFQARVLGVERLIARGNWRLMLAPIARPDLPPRVRVSLPLESAGAGRIRTGDAIALRARLVPPAEPLLPGGYDFARRAWFEGIGASGSVLGEVRQVARTRDPAPALRERLNRHVLAEVDGPAAGIAAALVTGDTSAIPEHDAEAMRRAGLAHLLSISGLHVTAAVGLAMTATLALLALWPWLALRVRLPLVAAAAGALVGLGYTLLTGSQVPTVRSLIAAVLVLGALAAGREPLSLRLVAAGALFVLALWPESLVSPSFQLSFAAIVAIVTLHSNARVQRLLQRRSEPWWQAGLRWLAGAMLTGLAVECALTPIALYHFHRTGLYGALANIVAIPLTTAVVMPAEALALMLDSVGLGAPAWWVVERSLGTLLWIAHTAADAPGAVTMQPSYPTPLFVLAVVGGLWLLLWQGRHRWIGLAACVLSVGGMALQPAPDALVTGDGRHVAVRMPDGRAALLRDRAGDYVRSQLGEGVGVDDAFIAIDDMPGARCNSDVCTWRQGSGGSTTTILALRGNDMLHWRELVAACARADVVIAARRLPEACRPHRVKLDRAALRASGGVAIHLAPFRITSVADAAPRAPWRTGPRVAPARPLRDGEHAPDPSSGSGAAIRRGGPE
mgnify:CR=1 FL=1